MLESTIKFACKNCRVRNISRKAEPKIRSNYSSAFSGLCSFDQTFKPCVKIYKIWMFRSDSWWYRLDRKSKVRLGKNCICLTNQYLTQKSSIICPVWKSALSLSKFRRVFANGKIWGTDLLHGLNVTIFGFHERTKSLTADIETMFLQVQLSFSTCLTFLVSLHRWWVAQYRAWTIKQLHMFAIN